MILAWEGLRGDGRARGSTTAVADVTAVVVTYNGLPWIERCLESVAGVETIVVDHGSTDGTVELVRERFPDVRVIEQENLGLGAGLNAGIARRRRRYFLLLNSDAWVVGDAVERLVAFADEHPRRGGRRPAAAQPGRLAPALGARLPDALAARDRVLLPAQARAALARAERVLRGRLRPRRDARGGVGDGRLLLVRRDGDRRGRPASTRTFFLFSEETDWFYRFHAGRLERAGSSRTPRSCTSAAPPTAGGCSRENVRGHLRFFAKHHGAARGRARAAAAARGRCGCAALLFRGERGRMYRDAARWLASGSARSSSTSSLPGSRGLPAGRGSCCALPALALARVLPETGCGLYVRLAAATLCLLAPGALVARALGRGVFAALSWSLARSRPPRR